MSAQSIEQGPGRPITDLDGRFQSNTNRVSFVFKHELAGNPLFDLENLVELARRMPDRGTHYWANGKVPLNNTWSDGTIGRQSLRDTIINIEHNNSVAVLRHAEQDPVLAPVLQRVLTAIIDLSGEPMHSDARIGEVSIVVSSPGRMTAYHMNSAAEFLLQVAGEKLLHVFDPSDRTLVTDRALEEYFACGVGVDLVQAHRRNECSNYDLAPGYGVHVPACAPHWIQNRGSVSVALSVNYALQSMERLGKLYGVNRRLRRLGLNPAPPHASNWRDRLKLAAAEGMAAMGLAQQRRGGRPHPGWTPPEA